MPENQREYNHLLVTQGSGQTHKKSVKWAVIAVAIIVCILILFYPFYERVERELRDLHGMKTINRWGRLKTFEL